MMAKFTTIRQSRNIKHAFNLFNNRRTLFQMLRETWAGHYKMSFLTKASIGLAVFYVLFPFDFITDLIPFFGWLDDGFVIFLLIRRLQSETHRYIRFKVMERRGRGF
jgi:uncharacterized membrane protein YkvA (DUF1232 family)